MKTMVSRIGAAAVAVMLSTPLHATSGGKVTLTGEVMDTWCYISQVMGGSDLVLGSAHHVCAVWCAAGGIPVGLLAEDGQVYMIMKFGDADGNAANDDLLDVQSHQLTVEGTVYERDGIKYLMVDKVLNDSGITNLTHETVGVIPGFALPKQ